MAEKLNKFAGIFPFLSNILACIFTVVALATTAWNFEDGWNHGLFQRCSIRNGKRTCRGLDVTVEERTASICLLASVAIHFAASVITCIGYIERKRKNFKFASVFSLIAGLVTLSGTTTYAVLTISKRGYILQYSFYISIVAMVWSFIATIASAVAISKVEFIPQRPKCKVAEESVTDVTVLT